MPGRPGIRRNGLECEGATREFPEVLLTRPRSYWPAFMGLAAYSVVLALLAGETGFQADDWWVLSVPYWHSFPRSFWEYVVEFKRPLDGLPWVTLFPLFGFNKIAWNLFALLLLAGACLAMGMVLDRAFPNRQRFVAASMLFAFFLPTVCPLTYVLHMDNMWLCILLFWLSVSAFQHWTARPGKPWSGLVVPILLYYLATLAYDATNLLVFLVPLFVWPVRERTPDGVSDSVFLARLSSGIVAGFAAMICTRFILFGGGAVELHSLFPSPDLVWSYIRVLPLYLLEPFKAMSHDWWSLALKWGVLAFSGLLLLRRGDGGPTDAAAGKSQLLSDSGYILLWGSSVMVLGIVPYLMAGYGAGLGFHGQSRVYSSCSFGLAVLLGFLATAWRSRIILAATKIAAITLIFSMAEFQADLRHDWQASARINCRLWTSLSRQVPDVEPGTVFLFLDLQSYIGNRAIVFGGVHGLREFIRIFYHRKDLNAHYLYPYREDFPDTESRLATVTPKGVVARGLLPDNPIPLDRLLIVERQGEKLVLLDRLSSDDKKAAIRWEGVFSIRSNMNRIVRSRKGSASFSGVCCDWCGL